MKGPEFDPEFEERKSEMTRGGWDENNTKEGEPLSIGRRHAASQFCLLRVTIAWESER